MAELQYQVNPPTTTYPQGTVQLQSGDPNGSAFVSEIHGKYYQAARNGSLNRALVTGKTIPAVTSAVVGVFAFVNPAGSNVNAEIVATTLGLTATATAVTFGWYWTNIATNVPTSPTAITSIAGKVGLSQTPLCTAYSALTCATGITPVLAALVGAQQSTSALQATTFEVSHDGRLIVPPGIGIWLCGSAAGPTSGAAASIDWVEWPV